MAYYEKYLRKFNKSVIKEGISRDSLCIFCGENTFKMLFTAKFQLTVIFFDKNVNTM